MDPAAVETQRPSAALAPIPAEFAMSPAIVTKTVNPNTATPVVVKRLAVDTLIPS
ncbi:hypothetical protein I546_6008 [Mycobacterium kansasii 732]|nr:hypothetical protein I546_6008 [Mycobacterium kansasii 732]